MLHTLNDIKCVKYDLSLVNDASNLILVKLAISLIIHGLILQDQIAFLESKLV